MKKPKRNSKKTVDQILVLTLSQEGTTIHIVAHRERADGSRSSVPMRWGTFYNVDRVRVAQSGGWLHVAP